MSRWLPAADAAREACWRVPADAAWFEGHFPERPILPGVALLALVARLAGARGARDGRTLVAAGLRHVRFRQVVLPGTEVRVALEALPPPPEGEVRFVVRDGERELCSGALLVRDASREG